MIIDDLIIRVDHNIFEVPELIDRAIGLFRMSGYRINEGCRFEQFKRRFYATYLNSIANSDFSAKIEDQRELLAGYRDYRELQIMSTSAEILSCSNHSVRTEINTIFKGGVLEGSDSAPWDYQFQYSLSSLFELSGFKVTLEEPDFTFEYRGKVYSVAAKRLVNTGNIRKQLRSAEKQIEPTNNYGFIAVSLDKIYNDTGEVLIVTDPDSAVRQADEIIHTIIKKDFRWQYFNDRGNQILGIIAHISLPFLYKSNKPTVEFGCSTFTMFLPINDDGTSEWNEVIDISNRFHNARRT